MSDKKEEQPGLEVAPELNLPHYVEGPTRIEKSPFDHPPHPDLHGAAYNQDQYAQQYQPQQHPQQPHQHYSQYGQQTPGGGYDGNGATYNGNGGPYDGNNTYDENAAPYMTQDAWTSHHHHHQQDQQQHHQYESPIHPQSAYPPSTYPQSTTYPASTYPHSVYPQSTRAAPSTYGGTYVSNGNVSNGPFEDWYTGKRVLGLRPKICMLVFGPMVVLLIVGLAVGLGVGLSSASKSDSSPTPSATSTPAPSPITCPSANGTIYDDTGNDDASFEILCNIDYNGVGGAEDLSNEEVGSVEDCIAACAGETACRGAGYGNFYGVNTCYLKGRLGEPQDATNWFFVVRQ
ncbi:hypothetical protein F4778DRAFT_782974 [Xylariomycetidae sp. FL2044]|nr:hypothetical protein F4778DRAFT_782974 [Xylariomycetidae sp. FL2044]